MNWTHYTHEWWMTSIIFHSMARSILPTLPVSDVFFYVVCASDETANRQSLIHINAHAHTDTPNNVYMYDHSRVAEYRTIRYPITWMVAWRRIAASFRIVHSESDHRAIVNSRTTVRIIAAVAHSISWIDIFLLPHIFHQYHNLCHSLLLLHTNYIHFFISIGVILLLLLLLMWNIMSYVAL